MNSLLINFLAAFSFLIFPLQVDLYAQETYNIATYNIRFDNPGDEGNLWKDRSPHLINLIRFHEMDIIGTQEGLYTQLEDISKDLQYPYIGVGRDTGGNEGEFSAVFYNPDKFELLDKNTFWLSPTPDKPSKGWDAALNRVCSWGKFQTEEGNEFYVFNVHYDHIGQKAREESSKLLLKKIQEINTENLPCILTGDFNVEADNPAYKELLKDGRLKDSKDASKTPSHGTHGTFNAFNWDLFPDRRIDYVFISDDFTISHHATLTDNYGKKYPSDHFPVMVRLMFRE
ncbi:endonuclease/exonuclease/phosphatase family protein [Cyclobacterium plantarum]|uniref:Endonuclease/exonuclease/phosphatase family protein n=1 Tax=Cyclobacterium plantarum TaxID=2716263 RepID=A0ABX0H101_9BACT|nr:endonuclease/exonuclease/phosphatase family protein [Cyclobacterium plantarum]NHE55446.1 endonuclease/exonuclease/phosphatase family protein [Cyclobacterium plantarum]